MPTRETAVSQMPHAPSCLSWRMDLGASVSQRDHQRGPQRVRPRAVGAGDGRPPGTVVSNPAVGGISSRCPGHPSFVPPGSHFAHLWSGGDKWAILPSAKESSTAALDRISATLLGIGRLLDLIEGTSAGPERGSALGTMRGRSSNWTRPSSWSPRSTPACPTCRCSSG